MNPRMCAIVHRCRHCVHLTPYRAPRNSAWMRLELPALGVAREDPRPGAACVHRPPSTLLKRHPLAHQWGSNYPCQDHSGGTRPSPRATVPWLSGPVRAQQKQQGPPPSPWRQMPRTQDVQREGNSRPRPSRAARHGCSRKANTQGPGRAAAHRSSSKMAGGI